MGDHRNTMRQQVQIHGIVQGVGFRPFVYGLAQRMALTGFVRNDAAGVTIEVEGPPDALTAFVAALHHEAPPLAQIEAVHVVAVPLRHDTTFTIMSSTSGMRSTQIAPDTAPCPDCLREMADPHDRRYQYPFLNCTNCGPRFTIVDDIPYDRANTSMAGFALCSNCAAEYADPRNRRFHAQPTACPVCGPQLAYQPASSAQPTANAAAALAAAVADLCAGRIVAIKGLGGYHLACDARNAAAVQTLRQRKHREAKPFALLVADVEIAAQLCSVNAREAALLRSSERPIVLLDRRPEIALPPALAPGYTTLGIMLPPTPLHELLIAACATPAAPPPILVLTSGNLSDEPIAYDDADALQRLHAIADSFLLHNRPIRTRCDDSVVRVVTDSVQPLRRARGYAPAPIRLARPFAVPVLAYGGHLKNTFCLGRGSSAFLSHHIGDLENLETLSAFRTSIAHYQRLFAIQPELLVHDLHPEYLATKEALAVQHIPRIGVQHHHAHIVSVLAEHDLAEPVIGIAADGTGYGLDGAIWGGELLLAERHTFTRLGHVAYIPLIGGEQAVRQPWRIAAAYLAQYYGADFADQLDLPFTRTLDRATWNLLHRMAAKQLNSPYTSSLGRVFDAVAALIGLRSSVHYEGQAAIELEAIAQPNAEPYPSSIIDSMPYEFDLSPTFAAIVRDLQANTPLPHIAGRFHAAIAALLTNACIVARRDTGVNSVALSGGVFQNRLLLTSLRTRLEAANFRVYTNRRVPPNDGGLSLGQAVVAAAVAAT
jgi:hydrogenase maturation protein HypF